MKEKERKIKMRKHKNMHQPLKKYKHQMFECLLGKCMSNIYNSLLLLYYIKYYLTYFLHNSFESNRIYDCCWLKYTKKNLNGIFEYSQNNSTIILKYEYKLI